MVATRHSRRPRALPCLRLSAQHLRGALPSYTPAVGRAGATDEEVLYKL